MIYLKKPYSFLLTLSQTFPSIFLFIIIFKRLTHVFYNQYFYSLIESALKPNYNSSSDLMLLDFWVFFNNQSIGGLISTSGSVRSADQKSDPTPSQPVVHIIPLSQAKEKNLLLKTHYQYLGDLSKENDKFSNFPTNSLEKQHF